MNLARDRIKKASCVGLIALSIGLVSAPAHAQQRNYQIPEASLSDALREYGRVSGQQIIFTESLVQGKRAPALSGRFTPEEALNHLLADSNLKAERTPAGAIMIVPLSGRESGVPREGSATNNLRAEQLHDGEPIVVTGSRVRGADPASPVTTITAQQMRQAGHNNLGEVVRNISQNFNGGQNPELLSYAPLGPSNRNVTSASAINLRGLGADATLTLLNGRRLPYDGFNQGVDISAIPLAAVDRIEVVTDGASAIYGSDAVAGVANVILKEDFDGVSSTARIGTSTSGGGTQLQHSLVAGTEWANGGLVLVHDYQHDDEIYAEERDYLSNMARPSTILPKMEKNSFLFSAHQSVSDAATVRLDALYNDRASQSVFTAGTTTRDDTVTKAFAISPSIEFDWNGSWSSTVGATYASDKSRFDSRVSAPTGEQINIAAGCFCNKATSAEIGAEGPVFRIPGGDARIAFGAGYRNNRTRSRDDILATDLSKGQRDVYYAYAEGYLPIVEPSQDIGMIRRLSVVLAGRYEKYKSLYSETTPKVGLIYAPDSDLEFKATWGRSFKAPTLAQESSAPAAQLLPAFFLGAGAPGQNVIFMSGGGDLKPEKAQTFVATAAVRPSSIPNFRAAISYFDVNYTDRVLSPVANLPTALTNPAFSSFVISNPSEVLQQSFISLSPTGLDNLVGVPYDPTDTIAIVDNRFTNVARQRINGIDVSVEYRASIADGTLSINSSMTWLDSRQRSTNLSPETDLSGTIFNPPHLRATAGGTWVRRGLTVSGSANLVGGLKNTTREPTERISSMSTVDLVALYRLGGSTGILNGLELGLTVRNLFNQQPPYAFINPVFPPYDPTNYSAIGRFVSVSITKRWF